MGTSASKPRKHVNERPKPKKSPRLQPSPRPQVKTEITSFKSGSSDLKGRDVMISYSHDDVELMHKLEGKLIM